MIPRQAVLVGWHWKGKEEGKDNTVQLEYADTIDRFLRDEI